MGSSVELFYLGKRYYFDSATQMTQMYSTNRTGYDWEDVKDLLNREIAVLIRQPNEKEREWADERLAIIQEELKGKGGA